MPASMNEWLIGLSTVEEGTSSHGSCQNSRNVANAQRELDQVIELSTDPGASNRILRWTATPKSVHGIV